METLLTTHDRNGNIHEVARARVFRLDMEGGIYDRGKCVARFAEDDLVDATGVVLENVHFLGEGTTPLSAHLGGHQFTTNRFSLSRAAHVKNGQRIGYLVNLRTASGLLVAKANGFVWRDDVRKVKELFVCDYELDPDEPAPLYPVGPRNRLSPLASRLV